jgi:hypothetical protein
MQSAAISPGEIRMKEGMEPYPGSDRYYIANNNFAPVDKIDQIVDAQIASKKPKEKEDSDIEERELNKAVVDYLRS